MSNVDWYYHRKNCNSCSKSADYLADHQVSVKTQVDARTVPVVEQDAIRLLAEVDDLYVTRGSKILHFDLKREGPNQNMLLGLLIGRSGKLRAPAAKVGRTLIVGFDQSAYEKVFG